MQKWPIAHSLLRVEKKAIIVGLVGHYSVFLLGTAIAHSIACQEATVTSKHTINTKCVSNLILFQ